MCRLEALLAECLPWPRGPRCCFRSPRPLISFAHTRFVFIRSGGNSLAKIDGEVHRVLRIIPWIAVSLPPVAPETTPTVAQTPERWFAEEVHAHDRSLKIWLRSSYPAIRDVEDIAQESYLRIWKASFSQPIASAKSFLFQVARRLAIDALRRKQTSAVESVGDWDGVAAVDEGLNSADQLCCDEKIELLAAAFVSLPRRCREVMTLRKLNGMPNREIAARLNISEGTVENQIARGTKLCRRYLNERGVRGFNLE